MNRKRIYISGAMTDRNTGKVTDENIMAFHKAEVLLREHGYHHIVNPAKVWACRWHWLYKIVGYRLTLLYDLWLLLRCGCIYKIPGWRNSRGANVESCMAYHFRIFTLPEKKRDAIDKKLAKAMEKIESFKEIK